MKNSCSLLIAMAKATDILDLMDQAIKAEHGIKVKVNDPLQFKDQCYLQRKYARDADVLVYDCLTFRVFNEEVWIVRNERRTNDGESDSPNL